MYILYGHIVLQILHTIFAHNCLMIEFEGFNVLFQMLKGNVKLILQARAWHKLCHKRCMYNNCLH